MFKNTNDFFKKVFKCKVSDIDIKNYVYIITIEHEPINLHTLKRDLEYFVFLKIEEIEAKITPEDWEKKINHYESKGIKIPTKIHTNFINKKLNEKNNNKDLKETDTYYDIEAIHYPYDLFCIRQLQNYIDGLIKNIGKENNTSDPKHENIFCNNGFVLFEHILNNYVKKNRGRKTDISFFYWSMYNNKPQYIHQRPERFKEWFFENYNNEDLGKIKTYDQVNNIDRQKHFSNALDWFKSQP